MRLSAGSTRSHSCHLHGFLYVVAFVFWDYLSLKEYLPSVSRCSRRLCSSGISPYVLRVVVFRNVLLAHWAGGFCMFHNPVHALLRGATTLFVASGTVRKIVIFDVQALTSGILVGFFDDGTM